MKNRTLWALQVLPSPCPPLPSCTSVCRTRAEQAATWTRSEPSSGRSSLGSWRSGSTRSWTGSCWEPDAAPEQRLSVKDQKLHEDRHRPTSRVNLRGSWPWCGTTRTSWWWRSRQPPRRCCSAHEPRGCRWLRRRWGSSRTSGTTTSMEASLNTEHQVTAPTPARLDLVEAAAPRVSWRLHVWKLLLLWAPNDWSITKINKCKKN